MRSALLLLVATLLALSALGAGAPGQGHNPHGDPGACLSCHAPGSSAEEPGPALPIVETCRGCHPTADMHPVGIAPRHVPVPQGWPLEQGLVTCATCHVEPSHGGASASLPSPWHRDGPYPSVTRFCYACHEQEAYQRQSPHTSIGRDPNASSCAACHAGQPVEGAGLAESRLRSGLDKVCTGSCHSEPAHAGVAEHLGVEIDPALAATLPASVPLLEGRIACFTCHEVHTPEAAAHAAGRRDLSVPLREAALAADWSALTASPVQWPGGGEGHPMLAASATTGELCAACHGEGP